MTFTKEVCAKLSVSELREALRWAQIAVPPGTRKAGLKQMLLAAWDSPDHDWFDAYCIAKQIDEPLSGVERTCNTPYDRGYDDAGPGDDT